jgi:cell volume regulation protein A
MDLINPIILVGAGLVVISGFTSVIAFRAGAPLLLLFLGIGLLAGRDGPGGLQITDPGNAFLVGSIALAVILFDSGFHTRLKSFQQAAGPAITLATVGVVATAALVALPAHWLLGLGWVESALLGTILSSTDAAALFFLLRVGGMTLRDRVRSTLEVESGTNDPVAIILTLSLVQFLVSGTGGGVGHWPLLALKLLAEIGGGCLFGLLGAVAIIFVANRVKLEPGLYPVVVMGLALLVFALTNLLGGSGYLAAYLAGLIAGNARLQSAGALRRFQDGVTWLAQIGMFVTLGLLAVPSRFPQMVPAAVVLAAALTFVARPLVVLLCLAPFGFRWREKLFIAWVGLRGAVSILLALVPILAHLPGADLFFEVAFLVVVASLAAQGWTVRPLARWLGLIVPERAGLVERLEVDLPGLNDLVLVSYVVHPDSAVAQGRRLPRWARPVLVRRAGKVRSAPRQLLAGDNIHLLVEPSQITLLDKLFGRVRDASIADARLYGDFALAPDVTVRDLHDAYGLDIPVADPGLSLADLFRREFRSDLEEGDRLPVGPVELIVREMRDGRIHAVGISLEPEAQSMAGWKRLTTRLAVLLGAQ